MLFSGSLRYWLNRQRTLCVPIRVGAGQRSSSGVAQLCPGDAFFRPRSTCGGGVNETTIEHAPLSRSGQQAVRAVTEAAASGILVLAADTRNVLYCNRRLFVLWGVESHYDHVSAGRTEAETVLDWFSDRALLPIPNPPPERTIDQEIALETGGTMRVRVRPLHGSGGELLGQLWLFDLAKGDDESSSPLHGLAFSGTDQARIYE